MDFRLILSLVIGVCHFDTGSSSPIPLLSTLSNVTYSSTSYNPGNEPRFFPLSIPKKYWATSRAGNQNPNEHFGIDLNGVYRISAIETGGDIDVHREWTESYKIQFSVDHRTWKFYHEGGALKVFTGNSETTPLVKQYFMNPITARFIRIYPVTYEFWKVMAGELYDVDECGIGTHTCSANSACTNTAGSYFCICNPGYTGDGKTCRVATCSDNPCKNGGSCEARQGPVTCKCPGGYGGKYCQEGSGFNVTCGENYMQVTMDKDIWDGISPQDYKLKSRSCTGTLKGDKLGLLTRLDSCGTTHVQSDLSITYWNKVFISFNNCSSFTFTCKIGPNVAVPRTNSLSTFVGTEKWEMDVSSSGSFGNFKFTMGLYRNANYSEKYGPRDYPVKIAINKPLFVEYSVASTTADLAVFAENCSATTTGSPHSWPRYDFIKDGCAVDDTMSYDYKLGRTQRFTINSFRFIANHSLVYLHCDLLACHTNSSNSRCAQGCRKSPVRSRRDTSILELPGRESFDRESRVRRDANPDESMTYQLTSGPMRHKGQQEQASPLLVGVGATFGGLFLLVSTILVIIVRRNKVRILRTDVLLNEVASATNE